MPPLFTIRTIIDLQVKDVVETATKILAAGVQSADAVRLYPRFSSSTARSAAN